MANQSLHERQLSVLRHLTNPGNFDGEPADGALDGLDLARMRLLAHMSLGKRMEKIRSALPRSFEYFADDPRISSRDFVGQFPPSSASRSENAIQFVDYLHGVWCDEPADPAFLPDLVALELAMAIATGLEIESPDAAPMGPRSGGLCLPAGTQLLRCRFDIRCLFDNSVARAAPIEHGICLVVTMPAEDDQPRIFEVPPDVYAMLKRIRLAEANNSTVECASGVSRRRVDDLIQQGILEVRA